MRWVRRLLLVAVFVGVLVLGWRFATQNAAPVSVDLLVARAVDVSLWLVVVVSVGTGAALAALVALYQFFRLSLVTRRYRRSARQLEAEVHQLRNLPLSAAEPAVDDPVGHATEAALPGDSLERGV